MDLVAIDDNEIVSSKTGSEFVKDYKENIEEELKENSTAKFGRYQGREMMVGALARIAISGENEGYELDYQNPFHNNFAQAIEILQFHRKAMEIIEKLLESGEYENKIIQPNFDELGEKEIYKGIGAVEAPRGGLYHEIHLDKNRNIVYANIITPTVQNLTSIEKSAQAVLDQHSEKPQKEKEKLLNMIVRAYDPCITCSVH